MQISLIINELFYPILLSLLGLGTITTGVVYEVKWKKKLGIFEKEKEEIERYYFLMNVFGWSLFLFLDIGDVARSLFIRTIDFIPLNILVVGNILLFILLVFKEELRKKTIIKRIRYVLLALIGITLAYFIGWLQNQLFLDIIPFEINYGSILLFVGLVSYELFYEFVRRDYKETYATISKKWAKK